jgi:hypothetical protein
MKLTIIPIDKAVYIDGVCHMNLFWEGTPEIVHALQWQDTEGWIEYKDINGKVPNEPITVLPVWANNAIESWTTANTSNI